MRRFLIAVTFIAAGVIGWYLFLRKGEFQVKFEVQTLPGNVVQTIRVWSASLPGSKLLEVDSVFGVEQSISTKDRSYLYSWNISQINDSTSRVRISISEPGNHLMNKLLVLLSSPQIEEDALSLGKEFYRVIKEHIRLTKVQVVGPEFFDERFCACTSLATRQLDKAHGMMKNYMVLATFIEAHNLTMTGKPVVDVQYWSQQEDKLKFDFCFPIENTGDLPLHGSIFYKTIPGHKALKANYFGNYITSDRAWYYLLQEANSRGLEVGGFPKEIFYNNPNMGGDETSWLSEVFLPVK